MYTYIALLLVAWLSQRFINSTTLAVLVAFLGGFVVSAIGTNAAAGYLAAAGYVQQAQQIGLQSLVYTSVQQAALAALFAMVIRALATDGGRKAAQPPERLARPSENSAVAQQSSSRPKLLGWVATVLGTFGVVGSVSEIQQHLSGKAMTSSDWIGYLFITGLLLIGVYTLLRSGRSS